MSKKILIVTNMGPKPSAPFQGQFVRHQVEALKAIAPEFFFMRWHQDSWLNRLFKYPVLWLQFVWLHVFSRQRFDIVHVHYFYPTIWLALTYRLLRFGKVKIVVTCHGSDIYLYKPESTLYKWAASQVDYWIFTSAELRQRFYKPDVKGEVLSAGIHPCFADVSPIDKAQKSIDVLYVGTLDFNKGMDRLLQLIPKLAGLKIAVIGHGSYLAKFEALQQRCPELLLLSPKSTLELMQYYSQSRCFLSLSRNESFGLVMTEAMACFTPVIATQTDGSLAQIRHKENGFIVTQTDEQTLVTQLEQTVQDLLSLPESEYHRLQQQSRRSAEQYLLPAIAERLTQIYQKL